MDSNLFQGDLVRLSVENPLNEAEAYYRWNTGQRIPPLNG